MKPCQKLDSVQSAIEIEWFAFCNVPSISMCMKRLVPRGLTCVLLLTPHSASTVSPGTLLDGHKSVESGEACGRHARRHDGLRRVSVRTGHRHRMECPINRWLAPSRRGGLADRSSSEGPDVRRASVPLQLTVHCECPSWAPQSGWPVCCYERVLNVSDRQVRA